MKLLFDENLSRKLAELYPGSKHVSELDLIHATDRQIWQYARENNFVIVTADSDFFDLAALSGPPPKTVWLRRWDHPTRNLELLRRREAVRIAEFAQNPELAILILDKR